MLLPRARRGTNKILFRSLKEGLGSSKHRRGRKKISNEIFMKGLERVVCWKSVTKRFGELGLLRISEEVAGKSESLKICGCKW